MPRILIDIPLCDFKKYSQIIALNSIKEFDYELNKITLFISCHTEDPNYYTDLMNWYKDNFKLFEQVIINFWNVSIWSVRKGLRDYNYESLCDSRNQARLHAIKQDIDYVFSVSSDIIFPKDTLKRLIAVNKPLVGGLVASANQDGGQGLPIAFQLINCCANVLHGTYQPIIKNADIFTSSCLLISREVFNKVAWRANALPNDEPGYYPEEAYYVLDTKKLGLGNVNVLMDLCCKHILYDGRILEVRRI